MWVNNNKVDCEYTEVQEHPSNLLQQQCRSQSYYRPSPGRILSPHLWCMVIDSLLQQLNAEIFNTRFCRWSRHGGGGLTPEQCSKTDAKRSQENRYLPGNLKDFWECFTNISKNMGGFTSLSPGFCCHSLFSSATHYPNVNNKQNPLVARWLRQCVILFKQFCHKIHKFWRRSGLIIASISLPNLARCRKPIVVSLQRCIPLSKIEEGWSPFLPFFSSAVIIIIFKINKQVRRSDVPILVRPEESLLRSLENENVLFLLQMRRLFAENRFSEFGLEWRWSIPENFHPFCTDWVLPLVYFVIKVWCFGGKM